MSKQKDPPKEKPKAIKILKVWRTRKRIIITYQKGDDELREKSRDNPLNAFNNSLDDLASTCCTICAFPKEYGDGMRIMGLEVTEKGGVEAVSIFAQKDVPDAAKTFQIHTPARLLEHPTKPGTYTPPLSTKDVNRLRDAIEAAKDYVKGKRAQGQLSLEDDEEDPDGDGPAEPADGKQIPLPGS